MWTQHCATLSCVVCRVCVDVRSLRDLIGSHSVTRSAATEKLSWTQLQAAMAEESMTAAAAPRGVPLKMNAFFFHRHHIWSECSLKSKPGSLHFPDTEFILLLLCAATLQKPHVKLLQRPFQIIP